MAKRAPKRAAHERRRLILEGAHQVFSAGSYSSVNTEKVARAAGVSAPALYRYFPSKKHLYLSTLEASGPRLLEIWRGLAGEAADPLEAVWTIGLGYYEHVRSRSPVTRLWFQALAEADDPQVRDALANSFVGAVDVLEANLRRGQDKGSVRADVDARIAAWHFMAIGLTMDLIHLMGRDGELNRNRVKKWGRLYLQSIGSERGILAQDKKASGRRTLPVRKPRRQSDR